MKKLYIGDRCKHGHLFDDDNTARRKDGSLRCRQCTKDGHRRAYVKGLGAEVAARRLERAALANPDRDREVRLEIQRNKKRQEYANDPAKFKARVYGWRSENPDYIAAYRLRADNRVHSNVSRAVRYALRNQKSGRGWESILGYTVKDLMVHLESKFHPGMTWDNYGKWEIDHKRPKSAFTFTSSSDPEFLACWSMDNLQPLWRSDNRRKHASIT